MEMPKLAIKNTLFKIFWATSLKNLLSDLKSVPSNLSIAKFRQIKTNMSKFGTKNALFGYFCSGILKKYCHIWNQHPRVSLIGEFCKRTKMPIFGNKNVLFKYFGLAFEKNYCHIWNLHPQICLIAKFNNKKKKPKLGTKNALFKYFWAKILKSYCHIWSQKSRIFQNCVFNSYIEFSCRIRFF